MGPRVGRFVHFFVQGRHFLISFENTWDKARSTNLPMKKQVRPRGRTWAYSLGACPEPSALPS
jgi:hypothetical protein